MNIKELEEFEKYLYKGKEDYFEPYEEPDQVKLWPEIQYTLYKGHLFKSYSRPMFEVEAPYSCFGSDNCLRCNSDSSWDYTYDRIISVRYLTVFDRYGDKKQVEIEFDPEFAATARHP